MLINFIRICAVLLLSVMLSSCDKAPPMELEMNVTMGGKPVAHARVTMDGKLLGETGVDGQFNSSMNLQPGKQVKLEALGEVEGFDMSPWNGEFTVKLPNDGEILKYVFDVDLQGAPYVQLSVREKGAPVAGAVVKVNNRDAGVSNEQGLLKYIYTSGSKVAALVTVSKDGYSSWKKSVKLEPGARVEVDVFKQIAVTFEALKDEYGRGAGIQGISIVVDGKVVGKTNEMGVLTYNYAGDPGKTVKVEYSAPGYLPAQWSTRMSLVGGSTVRHYFYPVTVKPIKVALYHFGGNTPGVDLKEVAAQAQSAIRAQLFKYSVFNEVSGETLDKEMKKANMNIGSLTSKGWNQTRMQGLLGMVVVGSVAKDDKGYLIEAKFHSAGGKLIYSQVIRADDRSDISSAAKEVVANVIERFPFEGTVVGIKDDRYEINLGKPYAISRGTEFALLSSDGVVTNDILTVKKAGDMTSLAALDDAPANLKVQIGDRVVRRFVRESEPGSVSKGATRESFVLSAKGGSSKDAAPLAGVNIYLNNEWAGATGSDGKAKVTIKTGKNFNLMLYRHGYQQLVDKIRIEKNGEQKQYALTANYALFKVETSPSPASIYIDGELLGKSPMLEGKQLPLGFHTVRVTAGDNYRDFEEVIEFAKKQENRTGASKIVLFKDYVKLGEAAEAKGNIDAAIAAYAATEKAHPDYSEAHHRLAQLYLDEKDDFNGAIREFENVLTLPENEQLIYKQYSVAYTNLGHAYYEKGNQVMNENRNDAAQYYAKAVQNLKIAKQNTRFFPAAEYDQAVHDTYFYLALSYQKLYMVTNRSNMLSDANLAWRDYFDFFPRSLEKEPAFMEHRETAKKFWNQIKDR